MKEIQYNITVKDTRNSLADALFDKSIFEYRAHVRDMRELESTLMRLARILADLPDHIGIIILDETKLSRARLSTEWRDLEKFVQSSVLSRLQMVVFSDNTIIKDFGDSPAENYNILNEIQNYLSKKNDNKPSQKPDGFSEILRVLLINWFRRTGPLQMKQIGLESGYSFPIIKPSLNKLEIHLRRYSDHSAELKSFPRGDWFKLLAVSDNIRFTMGYYAHRPRTVETLIERILEKPDRDVAFGGIIGARHYFPGIDLIGTHRLDLTVHNWDGDKTSRFIRMLDPGLKKVRSGEIPQVVLHNLFRPESFFIRDDDFPVADEVECLLDLHEARLEAQALDLLEYLIKKAKK